MKLKLKFKRENMWEDDESEFEIQNEGMRHVKVREFCEAKLPVEENEKGVKRV